MTYFEEKIVEPDVTFFYWSFVGVFLILILLVTILVGVLVKCLITDPITKLQGKIMNNEIDREEIRTREQ